MAFLLSFAAIANAQTRDAGAPAPPAISQCATADACTLECQLLNGDGCSRAYDILKEIDGRASDAIRAVDSACLLNQALACIELAKLMRAGITDRLGNLILRRDAAKALTVQQRGLALLASGCDGGSARYCGILADYYDNGNPGVGIQQDQAKAADLFQRACDAGDGYGCYSLGFNFRTGHGAAPDEAKAKSLFKMACAADSGPGCAEVGDHAKACRLEVRASCDLLCNQGNWAACKVGGPESQAKAGRREAESALPILFARCLDNRNKIEKLRIAGIQAARSGNRKLADEATRKLRELEPQWSETLTKLSSGIELVTATPDGGRDDKKYAEFMHRAKACSCVATRSGRCR